MLNIQSDKNKRGHPAADKGTILELAAAGKKDAEIASKMNISRRTVIRHRTDANFRKPRGGHRAGAGRKKKHDELLAQQAIDCATNSWEVGIGRKKLGDKDWFNYAGTAFRLSASGTYVCIFDSKDIPEKLPR